MKRLFSVAAFAALAMATTAPQATAATATAALDANSAYVWRGLTMNNGFVLQPSMDVSHNGFAFNVWGNYDVDDYDGALNDNRFSEIDLTGSYAFKLGSVDASLGIIHYLFPEASDDADSNTTELFAGLSYDLGAGFAISTKIYYDIDVVSDYYITAGLGYSYNLNDQTTLGLSALVSYAGDDFTEYYAGGTDSGFFNYTLTASVKYMATEAFGIGANINLADNLDDDALPDESVHTNVYGGISLTYTF
ncbi:MltA-interacting MipA family protein [Desulfobulbus elongatus]|uniref:MltA-interacting MipA family protein n=1 Tax=Desulfobulbus elongatus TaxID=53332 RepID=UPI00047F58B7|nr:MltA-interacting MipA family protein [Desulfobulbus elongatus]